MTTRSPNGRSTSRRTTAPKTKVSLDLDKLDAEGQFAEIDPFTFRHGGKVFTLGSPDDVDLFDIMDFGTGPAGNAMIFAKLLGDQFEDFRAVGPMPARKVNAVMEKYQNHYGVTDPGEAPASVASSNGTAKR